MIHCQAKTSFTPWWKALLLSWTADYVIKEYGDGSVHVYAGGVSGPLCYNTNSMESAIDWCEKQINDAKVKSTTYVMEDE